MHTGWKVRWAGMVTTSRSQSLTTPRMRGYQASENKILAKGGTEWENRKWYYLNSFTYPKREVVVNHILEFFFSSTICSISNDSKWFITESFVFLFIRDGREPKSTQQSPRIHPANFAGSRCLQQPWKYEIGTRVTLVKSKLSHHSLNPNLLPT